MVAATLLRNGDRLDRRGKVASRAHSIPNPIEVALQIGIELLDGPTVHASRAAIGFDRLISFVRGAIDFASMHKDITTIYVILPVNQLRKQAKWLRMFVNVAMAELLKAPPRVATLPPVLFMLDEFGNLGRLPEILNVLNIARDLRLQLWMFLQNLEQLKKAYKEESTYFFAGSGVVTTFDTGDTETAELFSKKLGKREVEMSSTSASGGLLGPLDFSDSKCRNPRQPTFSIFCPPKSWRAWARAT